MERRPAAVFDVEVNLEHPVSDTYGKGRFNVRLEGTPERQNSKPRLPSKQTLRTSMGDMPVRAHSRSNFIEEDRFRHERQVAEFTALVKELQAKNSELSSYLEKERLQR